MTTAAMTRENYEERLAALLIEQGHVDSSHLDRAQRLKAENNDRLDVILIRLGMVEEADMAKAKAELLGLPLVSPADYPAVPVLDGKLSAKFLSEVGVIPLSENEDGIILAMTDPMDDFAIQAVEMAASLPVLPRVAIPADIEAALSRLYESGKHSMGELVDALGTPGEQSAEEDIERLRDLASEAPVIRLVNLIIDRAVEKRASDIHIEPFGNHLRVRYRIDGVLHDAESPPQNLQAATVSRIKIMAKLNIAERRLPQDGRIRLPMRGKEIDLRVSTIPTMHGESVVLRVLDRSMVRLDFSTLGFDDRQVKLFRSILQKPDGIVLATGPTGSGKTTTLYASLVELNSPEKKILTVEDPIEYQLDGVNQIQVKPQIDLTFANVLRSILRQDPDTIMVGEIRDLETAQIAVQAALTGHLVLSTLHTNTAAAAATRLLDMGVEDYLLTSTVNGVVAQRLARTLCTHCREPYEALPEMVAQLGLERFVKPPVKLYRAVGCDHCNQTGFRGRISILEIMEVSDPIRQMILRHAEANEIQRVAVEGGMRLMFEDGVNKALQGLTTIEEVLRVTRES